MGKGSVVGDIRVLEGYGMLSHQHNHLSRPGLTHSKICLEDLSSGYTLLAIISPNSTSELPSFGAVAT